MMQQPSYPDLPKPSGPPTLPEKAHSGAPIKLALVRALSETLDAVKRCDRELDRAIVEVRRARKRGSLPPLDAHP